MTKPSRRLAPDTLAVTAGRPPRRQGGPVNPPVVLSSAYVSQGIPGPGELTYARSDTESWQGLEQVLGELEGSSRQAVVFASGMAAVAATMSLVPHGGTLVVPRHCYKETWSYARDLSERSQVTVHEVDIADTEAVLAVLEEQRPDMLWVESPTNPMLEVAELPTLVSAAHRYRTLVAVDNTFCTPLGARPLGVGADVVVHSVTKFLAGHSDVLLGAALTRSNTLDERLHTYRTTHGAVPGPWEAWLALRGVRTLALRMERSQANAQVLAERLAEHPRVDHVRYPGLASDPGHERAAAQWTGFGAMISIEVAGGARAADATVSSVRLWAPATSLGGVESTLERRRRWAGEAVSVPANLLRLSVGIENVEDLWRDLDQALRASEH